MSPLAAVVTFVAVSVVVTAMVGDRGLTEFLRIRDEHARLTAQLELALARNLRLQEAVRRLRQDPAAIEDAARRDLGLMRPGEKVFIIRDVPELPAAR